MLGELLALTNWEKTRNKITAIRRENPPGCQRLSPLCLRFHFFV
jgi:hypothetical protein